MKFFWIPAAVLAALLSASLWNAAAVSGAVSPWSDTLAEAVEASGRDDWDSAARLVRQTRESWESRHPWFHIVAPHDVLDQADALFAAAESFAAEQDGAEFRAATAELLVRFRVLAELEKLTVRNVL